MEVGVEGLFICLGDLSVSMYVGAFVYDLLPPVLENVPLPCFVVIDAPWFPTLFVLLICASDLEAVFFICAGCSWGWEIDLKEIWK